MEIRYHTHKYSHKSLQEKSEHTLRNLIEKNGVNASQN